MGGSKQTASIIAPPMVFSYKGGSVRDKAFKNKSMYSSFIGIVFKSKIIIEYLLVFLYCTPINTKSQWLSVKVKNKRAKIYVLNVCYCLYDCLQR